MPYRSTEIANEFLKLAPKGLTQMQLQKLAFIANGWNMVINGEPLIAEDALAWDYGPVYPALYEHTKFFGKAPVDRPITPDDQHAAMFFLGSRSKQPTPAYSAALSPRELAVISHVWNRYGKLGGIALSRLTHEPGTPWFETYKDGRSGAIKPELIADHYRDLAARAQRAA